MTTTLYILATLATFRITYLIVFERGPWSLSERLRSWVVNHYGARSWQAEGIQCPLCVSFWIALIAALPCTVYAVLSLAALGVWLHPNLVPVAVAVLFGLIWIGIAGGCLVLYSWLIRR